MEDNFEKKIRDVMNDPPEMLFDEQAWGKMQQLLKVEPTAPVSWRRWIPLLLLLLLSLMTLFGGTYFFKYSLLSERVLLLEQQLEFERQLSLSSPADTLTERHHIVVYDTTYFYTTRTLQYPEAGQSDVMKDRMVNQHQSFFVNNNVGQLPSSSASWSATYIPAVFSNQILSENRFDNGLGVLYSLRQDNNNPLSLLSMTRGGEESAAGENESAATHTASYALASLRTPLFFSEYNNNTATKSLQELDQHKSRKGLSYYASYISPTRYSVGAFIGSSRDMGIEAPKESITFNNNFSAGIRAMLYYGDHFSLLLGAEYFRNAYETEAEVDGVDAELYTKGFPILEPVSDSDKFHEMIAEFQYLQIPLAIQYNFFPNRKVQPYLGLGLMSRKVLRSKLAYEYNGAEGIYYVRTSDLLPDAFQLHTGFAYAGLRLGLTKQLHLQLEGRMEEDFIEKGTYNYEKSRFFKFNSGLEYAF